MWVKKATECGVRWTRNMWPHNPPVGPYVWMCVGGDGNVREREGVWGGSSLDDIDWCFDGWCVHTHERALEIADLVYEVLVSRPRVASRSWSVGSREGYVTALEGFNLEVNSKRSLIMHGRSAIGIGEGHVPDLGPEKEVTHLWRWWLDLRRPDGGTPWCMKSWSAFRSPEQAMAYAERLAEALRSTGFCLEETLA